MRIHIATLFDKNYLTRVLALFNSVKKYSEEAVFWMLCLDNESEEILKSMNLDNSHILSLADLKDADLMSVRNGRTVGEFAFTSKSVLINYVLENTNAGDAVIFSDADILFFDSPKTVIDGMIAKNVTIGITPHKFPKSREYMNEKVGKYNAGLLFFINNEEAERCVRKWRSECIDWCFLRYENGKLGDQMYLNSWRDDYKGAIDITDKGVYLGSWNIGNYTIKTDGSGKIWVDNEPLICYHFHGLRMYFDKGGARLLPISVWHDGVYRAYAEAITKSVLQIQATKPDWQFGGFIEKPSFLRLFKQRAQRFFRERIKK